MNKQQEIIEIIAKHLGVTPQDIELDASLSEDLGLSPIEVADLLNEFVEKYKINFDQDEIGGIKTVEDLVVLVEDLLIE